MLNRVLMALAFFIIWVLVILPLTPQLFSMIMSYIEESNVPFELQYEVKTPRLENNETVWDTKVYVINFKPMISILLLIILYIAPFFMVLKILVRRW